MTLRVFSAPKVHELLLHSRTVPTLVVQYLGVLKVNLWDFKGNILTQKG